MCHTRGWGMFMTALSRPLGIVVERRRRIVLLVVEPAILHCTSVGLLPWGDRDATELVGGGDGRQPAPCVRTPGAQLILSLGVLTRNFNVQHTPLLFCGVPETPPEGAPDVLPAMRRDGGLPQRLAKMPGRHVDVLFAKVTAAHPCAGIRKQCPVRHSPPAILDGRFRHHRRTCGGGAQTSSQRVAAPCRQTPNTTEDAHARYMSPQGLLCENSTGTENSAKHKIRVAIMCDESTLANAGGGAWAAFGLASVV